MHTSTTAKAWFGAEMKLVSVILFIVEFVRGAVLVSLLPIYGTKTLGLSSDIIGIAISAHYIVDTVLKMVIGYLLDRFSGRLVVLVGFILSLIGIYTLQFADLPWMFIGAAAIYGVGMSPLWIVCLTKVTEEHRATQMGVLYTIWLVGLGSGPIVCNVILDYSTPFAYQLLVGLSLLACILTPFMKKEAAASATPVPLGKQFQVLKQQISQMRLLLPGMILQTLGASMLLPILPAFAQDNLGLSGIQYSILLTAGGACAVIGLIPMGKLADRLGGKRWFLGIGFSAFAICLYVLAWGLSFWYCLFIAIGLGIAYSAILPTWNALLASYVPPKQEGLGWGMLSAFEGVGVMIGPVAGGFIALWNGSISVIWTSAILFAIIGIFYAIIYKNGD
ncbi:MULTISPECIES: MFS transporter [unclassified Paenibacillus]|uniref:MFS transporter n=1 Tax=unclassified Paenibacillus TaxID=185978 RepID=UPI002F42F1E6